MATYVMRVEAVDRFAALGLGRGGFGEDRDYEWYAGKEADEGNDRFQALRSAPPLTAERPLLSPGRKQSCPKSQHFDVVVLGSDQGGKLLAWYLAG